MAMTEPLLPAEPIGTAAERPAPTGLEPDRTEEGGMVLGRPVEDRSFEGVGAGLGVAAGLAIGTAVAGPIGTAVGGLAGAVAGFLAGEAIERAAGPAATTTDTSRAQESSAPDPGALSAPGPIDAHRVGPTSAHGFVTYPTNYLLAVADTDAQAAAGAAALESAGFAASDVVVIAGPEGEQFGRLGAKPGPQSRFVRMIQFTTMDQMPDFRAYEAAVLDGRTVVGVRIDAAQIPVARDLLLTNGFHFLNYYGRWSTAEVSPWRGPELDLPDYLRR